MSPYKLVINIFIKYFNIFKQIGNEHELLIAQMLLTQCQQHDNIHSVFLHILKEKVSGENVSKKEKKNKNSLIN